MLDEPNSNLDAEGEEALTQAILGVRARGGIVIVVAHRPSALAGVDQVLADDQAASQAFGPKDEVLAQACCSRDGAAPAARRSRSCAEAGGGEVMSTSTHEARDAKSNPPPIHRPHLLPASWSSSSWSAASAAGRHRPKLPAP